MYRINPADGAIYCPDGYVCFPPYGDEDLLHYLEYAKWVQSGNTPEEFHEEPVIPVPPVVSRFQARAALYQSGHLENVNSIMSSELTPMISKLAWQDAQEFSRGSNLVQNMGVLLGLSSDDLDNLFRLAASIEV